MNPLRLLQLWRERWGRDDFGARVPAPRYDPDAAWGVPLTGAPLWSMRGATALVLGVALLLLAFGAITVLERPQQTVLGAVMVAVGFYVRGRPGTLATLILTGLALLAGARYLAWRALHAIPPGDAQVPGMLVWLAELGLLLAFACWLLATIWPLYRIQQGSADAPARWPYVDAVLQPQVLGIEQVQALAALVERQAWPAARLRMFVQRDGVVEPELARFVEARGYEWIEADAAALAGVALPQDSNGEFLLLAGGNAADTMLDDPELLQRWTAWLHDDAALALLHSAEHPLVAPPSADARRLLDGSDAGQLALVRRSALERLQRRMPASRGATLDHALEGAGFRTAVVGHPAADSAVPPPAQSGARAWLRIDEPANGTSVRLRSQLLLLDRGLAHWTPVALAVLAFALLAIPLLGATPVNASFGWFASYALPYALLAFLAWNRAAAPFRRSLGRDALDWLQAAVLPFTVGAQALRAVRGGALRRLAGVERVASPLPWLVLGAAAVGGTLLRYDAAERPMQPWLAFAALLAVYVVVLRVAQWAVDQEVRTLRHLQLQQRAMAAVVRLPDRRLIPATTLNFPEELLELVLRDGGAALAEEGRYAVTLDATGGSVSLRGHGTRSAPDRLRFQPVAEDLDAYRRFAAAVRDDILRNHYWLPSTPPTPQWLRTLGLADQVRGK
ncbi:hypothetical protein MASR1M8_26750 [Thermomonas brevis]